MSAIVPQARLRAELDVLSDIVSGLRFDLESAAQNDRRRLRDHLLSVTRRYVEPRLADPAHPLVVAVFGPTGSGKSTLVNTLAGRELSPAGVIRPTTSRAVAWAHARHLESLQLMLGDDAEIVVDEHPVLASLVLVDTPDIDSIAIDHRRQTLRILEAADVAIAVTTPQRYADAVPWDVLGELTSRELTVAVVMNRSTRRSSGAVIDLAGLLRDAGVRGIHSADDILVIQEQRVRSDGRLHGYALRRLARRLQSLASDRHTVSSTAVQGAVRHTVTVAVELADEVEAQARELADLREVLSDVAEVAAADILGRIDAGDLIRGEVTARWQRLAGMSALANVVARSLHRVKGLVGVREDSLAQVEGEIVTELTEGMLPRSIRALTSVEVGWSQVPGGQALLDAIDVDRAELRRTLTAALEDWRGSVVDQVSQAVTARGRGVRIASYSINGLATMLILGLFASTGGLTGGEVGVTASAAAAQHVLLERLLGSAEVRRLERQAREELAAVVDSHLKRVLAPHHRMLDRITDEGADEIRDAAGRVRQALQEYRSA